MSQLQTTRNEFHFGLRDRYEARLLVSVIAKMTSLLFISCIKQH